MPHSPAFLKIVDDTRKLVKETDVAAVKERLSKGETLILIDVREDREWDGGRIRGAIHVGKGVIERDIEREVEDKNAEVILYCGGGFRSVLAAENIIKMGFKNVVSMDGGYRGWVEAGGPIEK